MQSAPHNSVKLRHGFTVVELLVVMGVLSLLLSLILPAVQSAREVSRRASCLSNLKQLTVACELFTDTHQRYPGFDRRIATSPRLDVRMTPHSYLLPYLDQSELYHRIEPHDLSLELGEPLLAGRNSFAMEVSIAVYSCPSDITPTGGNNYRGCLGTTTGRHATWRPGQPLFKGIAEEGLFGVFKSNVRPAKVTDGLSHTALFSERVVGDGQPSVYTPFRDIAGVAGSYFYRPNDAVRGCALVISSNRTYSYSGHTWVVPEIAHVGYNHVLTPNSRIPDCFDGDGSQFTQGAISARSMHPMGVNVAMADGSARFVSEAIDLATWRGIATVNGEEVVGEY